MILVTLGTQDKSFVRLLNVIQKEIDTGKIKDKVVVQAGYTKYHSEDMEIFELIPIEEFEKLLKKCDLLITHGGVGSIISGLKNGKKVIAVPRLAKFKEHTNDHQKQIINNFAEAGYILAYNEGDQFSDILDKVEEFVPKKYESNSGQIKSIIEQYIECTAFSPIRRNVFLGAIIVIVLWLIACIVL